MPPGFYCIRGGFLDWIEHPRQASCCGEGDPGPGTRKWVYCVVHCTYILLIDYVCFY